ncbi:hypothetical protein FXO38_03670 [Capsicum annuum]|nr:hypothetical protein FXO38_03670 [Capsicum annuum]
MGALPLSISDLQSCHSLTILEVEVLKEIVVQLGEKIGIFSKIIKTINSLESWNGGVLVVVSGSVKLKDFNGWMNFVQTFLLSPQEKGYFVLNDVFHFVNEEGSELAQAPVVSQNKLDAQPISSNPLAEPPGHFGYIELLIPVYHADHVSEFI